MGNKEVMTGELVVKNLRHRIIQNANEQPTFVGNDYVGDSLMKELIRYLAFTGTLASQGLVSMRTGIKFRNTDIRLEMNALMGGASANFDTTGQQPTKFTPYVLQPVPYEFKSKQDYNEMYKTWVAQAGAGFQSGLENNRLLPEVVMSGIMEELLEQIPLFHDQLYIMGKSAVNNANTNAYGTLPSFTNTYKGYVEILTEAGSQAQKLVTPTSAILDIALIGAAKQVQITVAGLDIEAGDFIEMNGIVNGGGGNVALLNRRRNIENTNSVTPKNTTALQVLSVTVSGANSVCLLNIKEDNFTTFGETPVVLTLGTPTLTNAKVCFINKNNVQDFVLNFWSSFTQVQRADPNFKIWVNPAIYNALKVSESVRLGGSVLQMIDRPKSLLLDEKMVVVDNLPVGTMVGISSLNAEVGLDDTLETFNTISMLDLFQTTREKFILFYAGFATCVGVKKTREAVITLPF